MRLFYYVHTGHRIGLNRFRRACTIIRALGDVDITLLCSDFRIANEARHFGVSKAVGVDVVQNIPKIANHGDKMIFDSDEANPIMLEDMRNYFSTFIRITDTKDDIKAAGEFLISPYLSGEGICNGVAVDERYFEEKAKTIDIAYFFGDDDYEKDLEKNLDFVADLNPHLQLGFYYFLDYEEMLRKKFTHHHEFEDYDDVIQKSKILITASPQAALESLAAGAKPIYVQREDHSVDYISLFESLHIPIVFHYEKEMLMGIIRDINNINYFKTEHSTQKIANFLKETLNL
ncbi:MAG: hypothetical protein PHX44_07570 [Sulfurimonas sp.]|uniref:hypothetical protein n=1 Tax=Sulfurimonas sp. TaxID=2022749 RepID=UPI002620AC4E|nr:hypothetical protein [Sulfurimonas sp.]MDD2652893.1 hypothetical protein [Sulfurimonas sp.]MDD3452339.1 hypothetical protein [Sulfurimonas sp.]